MRRVGHGHEAARPGRAPPDPDPARRRRVALPLPIRVTLTDPPPGAWLTLDLHGATPRREPRGFVGQGGSQRVDPETRTYAFAAPVIAEGDLGSVTAIVFLSRSGRWADRTAVAATEPDPVCAGDTGALQPLPAYDRSDPVGRPQEPSPTLRVAIAALWLLARRPPVARAKRRAAAALWLYAGISLAGLLSWHEADRLLGAAVLSVPVAQIAKLATALIALVCARRSR